MSEVTNARRWSPPQQSTPRSVAQGRPTALAKKSEPPSIRKIRRPGQVEMGPRGAVLVDTGGRPEQKRDPKQDTAGTKRAPTPLRPPQKAPGTIKGAQVAATANRPASATTPTTQEKTVALNVTQAALCLNTLEIACNEAIVLDPGHPMSQLAMQTMDALRTIVPAPAQVTVQRAPTPPELQATAGHGNPMAPSTPAASATPATTQSPASHAGGTPSK